MILAVVEEKLLDEQQLWRTNGKLEEALSTVDLCKLRAWEDFRWQAAYNVSPSLSFSRARSLSLRLSLSLARYLSLSFSHRLSRSLSVSLFPLVAINRRRV
jgi:hypothetical protein